ncbi:MAG: hypothetical protein N4A49_13610 [Marinifilaceae bacterium]|jgi:hypothetical protein|nr:hypothetical protein [Marinifilaceae bacterium]
MNKSNLFFAMISISTCLLHGCIYNQSGERIKVAWEENDSIYFRKFIKSLKHKSVEEVGAISETTLSEHTNLSYGMMYYPRREGMVNFWDTIPEQQKETIKQNIIAVWITYIESDLFLKKKSLGINRKLGETKSFHEKFHPKRAIVFNKRELQQIKSEMDRIASNCN